MYLDFSMNGALMNDSFFIDSLAYNEISWSILYK